MVGITGETCKVQLPSGPTNFRSTVVKPYYEEGESTEGNTGEEQVQEQEEEQELPVQRPRRNPLPLPYRQTADISIYIATPSYVDSRTKEINGLLEKGVFEIVDISTVPEGTCVFNSRFVDEIKNKGTDQAFEKSHLVVQAYNNQENELVLIQSPTIQRSSQRLILALAPSLLKENANTALYLRDISQAYVQSTTFLNCDFYV